MTDLTLAERAVELYAQGAIIAGAKALDITAQSQDWKLDRLAEMVKFACKERMAAVLEEWSGAVEAVVSEQALSAMVQMQAYEAGQQAARLYRAECLHCGTPLTAEGICKPCADFEAQAC